MTSRVGVGYYRGGTRRLMAGWTVEQHPDQTRRVKVRRCSVDLTWLALSQGGVNDFICRQYLHRPED